MLLLRGCLTRTSAYMATKTRLRDPAPTARRLYLSDTQTFQRRPLKDCPMRRDWSGGLGTVVSTPHARFHKYSFSNIALGAEEIGQIKATNLDPTGRIDRVAALAAWNSTSHPKSWRPGAGDALRMRSYGSFSSRYATQDTFFLPAFLTAS